MKGIYLTDEAKKEIEAKIDELRNYSPLETDDDFINRGKQIILEEILSSATILPVEKSWDDVELYPPDNESQIEKTLRLKNGVIIQPKQETIEEAAEKYASHSLKEERQKDLNMGFQAGAKWQAERMYSEEEVLDIIANCDGSVTQAKKWFEQFKKK